MNRRTVLSLMASFSVLSGVPRARAAGRSVIVIDAGLAGLTAARKLVQDGADVAVIEARDRIGERIWTSHVWPDLPMDLGGSWIHGTGGNPLTALADAIGAKRLATSYDASVALDAKGTVIDLSGSARIAKSVIEAARGKANNRDRDQSLQSAIETSTGWKSADAAGRRLIRHFVNGTIDAEYGGDVLFPKGFHQIIDHLAKGLTIRTATVVTSIAPAGKGVAVTLQRDEVLRADHVIVTVPLGVLKKGGITFAEPLRHARQPAIATIGMGVLNKCWLRVDRVAWPADVDWIEWLGPMPGHWSQWASLVRIARAPVLLG